LGAAVAAPAEPGGEDLVRRAQDVVRQGAQGHVNEPLEHRGGARAAHAVLLAQHPGSLRQQGHPDVITVGVALKGAVRPLPMRFRNQGDELIYCTPDTPEAMADMDESGDPR
jgi:hypothetical protein